MRVKYRQPIRQLRRIATEHGRLFVFVRESAKQELWEIAGRRLTILRHREINERTARGIIGMALEEVAEGEE